MATKRVSSGRQPWSARFAAPVGELMLRFGASIGCDQRLAWYDIRASRAHARMLVKCGIISKADGTAIDRGLSKIGLEIEAGNFVFKDADEDVHTAIERRLIVKIGAAGGRLHTARSRNDQVATDARLWLRDAIDAIGMKLASLRLVLLTQARRHQRTIVPGLTHLQLAQPITFGHHLHAYECMFARDGERLEEGRARMNFLPLGSAALAGTSFPIDRQMIARELGFAAPCANSIDAVSDRDFMVDFAATGALIMTHLSRLSEELILWSASPFGYVRLADSFSTGSSIMPQKRNPDAAELVRGKVGRVYGHLVALLTMLKAQPLAYNKDLQEDKPALFDCVDTVGDCLAVAAGLIESMAVDQKAMRAMAEQGWITATELADLLVRKGLPFRTAHGRVAAVVRAAEERGCLLAALPEDLLHAELGLEPKEVLACLNVDRAVAARSHYGGPAPAQLGKRLAEGRRNATVARARHSRRLAGRKC